VKKENIMNGQFNRGFTLIELLVTMAVAAILMAIAVPSYRSFMISSRIATESNDFLAALNLARSEAIKRSSPVTLCKSANAISCTTAGDWAQGWIVFEDCNRNGMVDLGTCPDRDNNGAADNEEIIRVHAAMPAGWSMNGGAAFANYLTYFPIPGIAGSGAPPGIFVLCPTAGSGVAGRDIQVLGSGRMHGQPSAVACP